MYQAVSRDVGSTMCRRVISLSEWLQENFPIFLVMIDVMSQPCDHRLDISLYLSIRT